MIQISRAMLLACILLLGCSGRSQKGFDVMLSNSGQYDQIMIYRTETTTNVVAKDRVAVLLAVFASTNRTKVLWPVKSGPLDRYVVMKGTNKVFTIYSFDDGMFQAGEYYFRLKVNPATAL